MLTIKLERIEPDAYFEPYVSYFLVTEQLSVQCSQIHRAI